MGGELAPERAQGSGVESELVVAVVERQLGRLFHSVRQRWRELAAAVHPDVQPVGFKILVALVDGGETHAKALTDMLGTDKSVLSRQVHQLEELGLVERRVDEEDARARRLAATPEAVRRITAIRASHKDELRNKLSRWDTDELVAFADMLRRLSEDDVVDE